MEPAFPISITPRVFSQAKEWVEKLSFKGFSAMAVDDTKLNATIRTYWDSENERWVLLGVAGEPPVVADEDALEQIIEETRQIRL